MAHRQPRRGTVPDGQLRSASFHDGPSLTQMRFYPCWPMNNPKEALYPGPCPWIVDNPEGPLSMMAPGQCPVDITHMRLYLSWLLNDPDEALSLMANDQLPCMVEVKHRHTGF